MTTPSGAGEIEALVDALVDAAGHWNEDAACAALLSTISAREERAREEGRREGKEVAALLVTDGSLRFGAEWLRREILRVKW